MSLKMISGSGFRVSVYILGMLGKRSRETQANISVVENPSLGVRIQGSELLCTCIRNRNRRNSLQSKP